MSIQKFIVSSSALLRAVKEVSATILPNPIVPILENVLLSFFRDGSLSTLHVYGSSTEVELFTSLQVESAIGTEDFQICLPAKLLAQTLGNLPDQPLTVSVNVEELRVEIKAARSRYKVAAENGRDFPRFKEEGEVSPLTLPAETLYELLHATVPFVSNDDRICMTAVFLHRVNGKLVAAATNGHLVTELKAPDPTASGIYMPMLLPAKTAGALLIKLLDKQTGDVTVDVSNKGWLRVRTDKATLRCRLIDERYVDYQNVIPINNPHTLVLNREELLTVIKEVTPFANQKTQSVKFTLDKEQLSVSAEDLDFEQDAVTSLIGQYDGLPIQIAFGSTYLLSLVRTVMPVGEVKITLSSPNRAAVMSPTHLEPNGIERLALLMPVMPNTI